MKEDNHRDLPIGVFDSGVGGLTVLKAIQDALPNENLIYLGDTARLPYGTKSPASIERYATQAAAKLQEQGIKLLVVACNTASAVALDALRDAMAPLPVVGVVDPGATAAVEAHAGGRHLVLATEATVRLGAYSRAIAERDPAAEVRELACEMLVSLAEEGWSDGNIARAIVRRYLDETNGEEPDTIILGCTHFPLLKDTIRAVANSNVTLVDSASTTAGVVSAALASGAAERESSEPGTLRLLATDGATRFARVGGQFLGRDLSYSDVELVDL
ncbi:MAG: glutamate racemase [Gammaproteobacteria bacterium]|nr:glutamate racemase [Gammaproteobacteria bacterium]